MLSSDKIERLIDAAGDSGQGNSEKGIFLDHVIIPGVDDGDRYYAGWEAVPSVGDGVCGFFECEKYLFRVVGVTVYNAEYPLKDSKAAGALLLEPVSAL